MKIKKQIGSLWNSAEHNLKMQLTFLSLENLNGYARMQLTFLSL